jgi:hypothetical protein
VTEKRQCGRCGSFRRLRSPENLRRYGVYGCCKCVEKKDDIAEYERLIRTGQPVDFAFDKLTILLDARGKITVTQRGSQLVIEVRNN